MRREARSGFTTAEIVIALVIIGILLLIAIPQFTRPTLTAVSAPDSIAAPNGTGRIAVRVTSARGTPQRGVTVRFESAGKGTVDPTDAITDSTGLAATTWKAAADTGELTVTVHAAGRTNPELVLRSRVRAP